MSIFSTVTLYRKYFLHENARKIIAEISIQNLMEQVIEIPGFQRIIDRSKVNDIFQYQDCHYKEHNRFNFIGALNIQCLGDTNYLIDGQHRYGALQQLHKHSYSKQTVVVEIIKIDSLTELAENYRIINQNTPLPDFPENIDSNIAKDVAQVIQNTFPNIWKKSRRPTRPFINFNQFQEAIGFLLSKLEKRQQKITAGQLIKLILEKNHKMKFWDFSQFNEIKRLKSSSKLIEKCRNNDFYLGMYPHKSHQYGYDWVRNIIRNETGSFVNDMSPPKTATAKKKKPIPPVLKEKVWELYIGDKIKELCLCCSTNSIKNTNFHCGHIIAEHHGGTLDLTNLRPICKSCNTSMGVENAVDYVERNYPKNKKRFTYGISKKPSFVMNLFSSS